jgi:hypothetical protein
VKSSNGWNFYNLSRRPRQAAHPVFLPFRPKWATKSPFPVSDLSDEIETFEMERTKMNRTKSNFNAERIFLRSCLESAPQTAQLRSFNFRATAPQRAPTRLHQLKQKLLHTALEQTVVPHVQRMLCGAANVAAEMAWNTANPLLLFPCLFEEIAVDILNRHAFEEPTDDRGADLSAESDPVCAGAGTENGSSRPILEAETGPSRLGWKKAADLYMSIWLTETSQ